MTTAGPACLHGVTDRPDQQVPLGHHRVMVAFDALMRPPSFIMHGDLLVVGLGHVDEFAALPPVQKQPSMFMLAGVAFIGTDGRRMGFLRFFMLLKADSGIAALSWQTAIPLARRQFPASNRSSSLRIWQ